MKSSFRPINGWHRQLQVYRLTVLAIGLVLVIGIGGFLWLKHLHQINRQGPFTSQMISSIGFPLYYPKNLPSGYRIDSTSISEPQSGVVVFAMQNAGGQKLYMSEQVRPATFNLGGYYDNFNDRVLTVTQRGTIAVGRINQNKTEIGSIAIGKTWILTNTTGLLSLSALTALLKSLMQSD